MIKKYSQLRNSALDNFLTQSFEEFVEKHNLIFPEDPNTKNKYAFERTYFEEIPKTYKNEFPDKKFISFLVKSYSSNSIGWDREKEDLLQSIHLINEAIKEDRAIWNKMRFLPGFDPRGKRYSPQEKHEKELQKVKKQMDSDAKKVKKELEDLFG